MTNDLPKKDRLTSTPPLTLEDTSSPSTAERREVRIPNSSPIREPSMEFLFANRLAAREEIWSPSSNGYFQDEDTYPLPSTSPMFLFPNSPNPLAPRIGISSPALSGYTQNGETHSLRSTPTLYPYQKTPSLSSPYQDISPNPIPITLHKSADVPAPAVELFHYECKICPNKHIFMPNLVAEHLVTHKHPKSGEWVCTSCGKEYVQGRWGYGMLLMHLQGRGGSKCKELIDLRAQHT